MEKNLGLYTKVQTFSFFTRLLSILEGLLSKLLLLALTLNFSIKSMCVYTSVPTFCCWKDWTSFFTLILGILKKSIVFCWVAHSHNNKVLEEENIIMVYWFYFTCQDIDKWHPIPSARFNWTPWKIDTSHQRLNWCTLLFLEINFN